MSNVASCVAGNLAAISFAPEHEHELAHECITSQSPQSVRRRARKNPRRAPANQFKEQPRRRCRRSRPQAEKVLRAFNTWAFKREQPSDPQLMLRFITDAIATQAAIPVRVVLGQGSAARNRRLRDPMSRIPGRLAARVRKVYAHGAAIKLILTDTHAELNGHSRANIRQYFDDITASPGNAASRRAGSVDLVKAAGNLAAAAPIEETVSAEMLGGS